MTNLIHYIINFFSVIVTTKIFQFKNNTKLYAQEKKLSTQGRSLSAFHQLALEDHSISLNHSGYVVAIEKAYRNQIGLDKAYLPNLNSKQDIASLNKEAFYNKKEYSRAKFFLSGLKRTLITHIAQTTFQDKPIPHLKQNLIYNLYKNDANLKNAYQDSDKALDILKQKITNDINTNKSYTHIILYAHGWNTNQQATLQSVNAQVAQLIKQTPDDVKFNPLIVAITWPSEWAPLPFEYIAKALSYPTKANDADEIGLTHANKLLQHVLIPIKKQFNLPLICIGHSFGARLLSRAICSPQKLNQTANIQASSADIDLFIGLQAAFCINRFLPNKGIEGGPYHNFSQYAKKSIFTWSKHDIATPVALWVTGAKHVGSVYSHIFANKYLEVFTQHKMIAEEPNNINDITNFKFENPSQFQEDLKDNTTVALIDATQIIRHNIYRKGGNAHNDIHTPILAKLIHQCIH